MAAMRLMNGGGALRHTRTLLYPSPDEQSFNPNYGGRSRAPAPQGHDYLPRVRTDLPAPAPQDFLNPFVKEWDRERVRAFVEHRHQFFFLTRKMPEFWKNYEFHYKMRESIAEWREARVRRSIEKLFMNDAVQCSQTEGYEVKRVADKLVTLAKDGSRTSRRIIQEFFEYKPWGGGKTHLQERDRVDQPGDLRVMYKILDDFPQRYKNRHGDYALYTPTSTHMARRGGPFINPDNWKSLNRRRGRVCIVEMKDRDMSIFHRGQIITGDKGADVWDKEKDRPQLHSGTAGPEALRWEDQYMEEQQALHRANLAKFFSDKPGSPDALRAGDFVANPDPSTHLGFQSLVPEEPEKYDLTDGLTFSGSTWVRKGPTPDARLEDVPTDISRIDEYMRNTRFAATSRELYKDENFYKMFPSMGDEGWIEKVYEPFMRMSSAEQVKVWKMLDNANIHNRHDLTEGLPMPPAIHHEVLEDHYKSTWKTKLEYMGAHPNQDPRDKEILAESEKEAVKEWRRGGN
eukprot:Hpha_TRINITY_DN8994_c0_g1::TRINITY_DN8994_c0_g1_i1::g.80758::m.80758